MAKTTKGDPGQNKSAMMVAVARKAGLKVETIVIDADRVRADFNAREDARVEAMLPANLRAGSKARPAPAKRAVRAIADLAAALLAETPVPLTDAEAVDLAARLFRAGWKK